MISSNYIPEKISEYNAYLDGSKMIGVAASVTLPEINMKTSTVSGVGVNGELDSPTIVLEGQWEDVWQSLISFLWDLQCRKQLQQQMRTQRE